MGRFVDLCGEIAAEAEEGPEGLVLAPDVRARLRAEWEEEDIEDATGLVRDSLLQSELVDAADSLSGRMVEVLGAFGEAGAFHAAVAGTGPLSADVLSGLARRVERLEEILEVYREGSPPDRRGFDALRRRLMDQGIEEEMRSGAPPDSRDDEDE
ncbi:MAG: hypothetical protein HY317_05975 [Acidobacteria bacterium]|nr:hypothetical protein [Acidobacteriota bacterium]